MSIGKDTVIVVYQEYKGNFQFILRAPWDMLLWLVPIDKGTYFILNWFKNAEKQEPLN